MKSFSPSYKFLLFSTLLVTFLTNQALYSQNTASNQQKDTVPFIRFGNISTKFIKPSFELKKGSIISNVLKVVNHDTKAIRFTVDALFPGGWTRIDDATKIYTARAKDTVIVPLIITPTKLVNGNTEIIINAFVIAQDGQQIGNNFFTLTTKKKIAWSVGLQNNTNYYFKNDENEKNFSFSVNNDGNYDQDVFISYTIPRKDLVLADTLANEIKDPNRTFTLKPGESKEFAYKAVATSFNERNKKRISINNFSPITNTERVTRTLVLNSSEPKITKGGLQKKTKLNFIKLPNQIEANPYGYPYLPLIVDLNAQNVLDDRSFLSLNLQGFKQLNSTASLIYFTQFNYSNSFFTNNVFRNAPWYVGYFDDKKSIEIGQVSGDLIGTSAAGKGIKASYRFTDRHTAGAFFTNSAGFFDTNNAIISYGGWYNLKYNEDIRVSARAGRSNNKFINRTTTVATLQPSVRFLNKHTISLLGGYSLQEFEQNNTSVSTNGVILGTNYSSSLFNRKLKSNFSVRYNDRNFSSGTSERIFFNQRVTYELSKDWLTIFSGNYQKTNIFNRNTDQFLYTLETLFTNVIFSKKTETGSYQPGAFFEYRNFPNNSFALRGLNFRYSAFSLDQNFLSSIFTRAGYAKPRNQADTKEYFSLEVSGLFRYRTWNATVRYNLGTFSSITSQQNQNDLVTPQSLRLSVQNQHLFANRHFALESSLIYSFNNVFKNHTLGIFPQAYYFSNSGWRFGISANYVFTTSDFSSVFDINDPNIPNQQNIGPTTNSNLNLNFNLRKEFGIPIPFTKKIAATTKFVSFLDVNGNGIKEKDEVSVQNVVVKLNKNEVITNFEGEATIKNLKLDKYKLETIALEDLNGWFANVQDSIVINQDGINYIPFVRGIKVYGDVIVDRQKIAVTDEKPLDLSRIKISAVKGDKIYNTLTNSDGRFEFYLPFGQYTITMDEGILGDRFRITRNNLSVRLRNNQDGVYVSFYIVEKRRKVIFKDFTKKKNE
ncbi:hypothetical protein AAON49_01570 [Pseudotenacibaculum sp. MALMAid0570]|uniref:hypothetical protein n=1 Tax=Pseudotenacibaculum sp. MALMAid0570 TaxID=3143938 RepID=UPI0032DE3382